MPRHQNRHATPRAGTCTLRPCAVKLSPEPRPLGRPLDLGGDGLSTSGMSAPAPGPHSHPHGHQHGPAPTEAAQSRRAALQLLAASAALAQHAGAASASAPAGLGQRAEAQRAQAAEQGRTASCLQDRRLSGKLAANLNGALYASVISMGAAREGEFQKEVYQLRDREYPYYYEANQSRLPRVPDLTDMSGGMSNPTYFNFVSYILWKVAARQLPDALRRAELGRVYGRELLPRVWEGAEAAAQAARLAGPSERASEAAVLGLVQHLLERLQEQGYMCSYQVVWGELPGGWPADWMVSEPKILGQATQGSATGSVFQIKLHLPADLEGSVALRAEESGFWSHAVSCALARLLELAGHGGAAVDEFFYQDSWGTGASPRGWSERLLLLLGDPLQQLDVPFVPSSLVQNWQLGE